MRFKAGNPQDCIHSINAVKPLTATALHPIPRPSAEQLLARESIPITQMLPPEKWLGSSQQLPRLPTNTFGDMVFTLCFQFQLHLAAPDLPSAHLEHCGDTPANSCPTKPSTEEGVWFGCGTSMQVCRQHKGVRLEPGHDSTSFWLWRVCHMEKLIRKVPVQVIVVTVVSSNGTYFVS